MTVKLTPSNLTYWYESGCPAAWDFDREWEALGSKEWAERGTLVHSMMEGTLKRADVDDKLALAFYDKLNEFWVASGWTAIKDLDGKPLDEVKQRFRIAPGVDISRKIDRLATDENGKPLIIDWKTTPGYGWKTVTGVDYTNVYPQAHGFQSIGYLLPPPADEWAKRRMPKKLKWPKRMVYVVAPLRGAVQVLSYEWSDEDYENFVQATEVVSVAAKKERFPKIMGKACFDCRYKALCHESPGWEGQYRRRYPAQDNSDTLDGEPATA